MRDKTTTSKERLKHIVKAIDDIRSFTSGINEKEFEKNLQVQSAVLYQFIIIGEAIIHVDSELLKKYNYPWHLVRTFRNFVAHVYHKVKIEKVWNTIQELNELKSMIEIILKKEF